MKRTERRGRGCQRGFMLISAYLAILVMAIFSLAFYWRHHGHIDAAELTRNKIVAFNVAEAGLDMAIATLTGPNGASYAGTAYASLNANSPVLVREGGYTISVCSNTSPAGSCGGAVLPTNAQTKLIVVTGEAPEHSVSGDPNHPQDSNGNVITGYARRTVQAYVSIQNPLFTNAVFANGKIKMIGHVQTDSYDSRSGAYQSGGQNGNVTTNSTASCSGVLSCLFNPPAVAFLGHATVNGNVTIGPGGNPSTAVRSALDPNPVSAGHTVSAATQATNYSTIPTPAGATELGEVNLLGSDSLTLEAGNYHASSFLIAGGTAKVVANGPVKLYVDGAVIVGGHGIVASQPDGTTGAPSPPNVVVYSTGSEPVIVARSSNFYGGIYAPNSSVAVGCTIGCSGASVYGAVVAKDFIMYLDGAVHFDEAMKTLPGGPSSGTGTVADVLSWVEKDVTNAD